MTNISVFRSACEVVGGKGRLAAALGVSPPSVHQWYSGIRPIPADRVLSIARATGWRVTPHELRPDLYPNPTDGLPPDHPLRQAGQEAA